MVFQDFNLFPHMSVLANLIEAPTRVLGVSRAEATERAEKYLGKVGLAEKRDEFPARSEEHTSELQSLMRISYAVFCLKKKKNTTNNTTIYVITKSQRLHNKNDK